MAKNLLAICLIFMVASSVIYEVQGTFLLKLYLRRRIPRRCIEFTPFAFKGMLMFVNSLEGGCPATREFKQFFATFKSYMTFINTVSITSTKNVDVEIDGKANSLFQACSALGGDKSGKSSSVGDFKSTMVSMAKILIEQKRRGSKIMTFAQKKELVLSMVKWTRILAQFVKTASETKGKSIDISSYGLDVDVNSSIQSERSSGGSSETETTATTKSGSGQKSDSATETDSKTGGSSETDETTASTKSGSGQKRDSSVETDSKSGGASSTKSETSSKSESGNTFKDSTGSGSPSGSPTESPSVSGETSSKGSASASGNASYKKKESSGASSGTTTKTASENSGMSSKKSGGYTDTTGATSGSPSGSPTDSPSSGNTSAKESETASENAASTNQESNTKSENAASMNQESNTKSENSATKGSSASRSSTTSVKQVETETSQEVMSFISQLEKKYAEKSELKVFFDKLRTSMSASAKISSTNAQDFLSTMRSAAGKLSEAMGFVRSRFSKSEETKTSMESCQEQVMKSLKELQDINREIVSGKTVTSTQKTELKQTITKWEQVTTQFVETAASSSSSSSSSQQSSGAMVQKN